MTHDTVLLLRCLLYTSWNINKTTECLNPSAPSPLSPKPKGLNFKIKVKVKATHATYVKN